jgi:hypothetical protein
LCVTDKQTRTKEVHRYEVIERDREGDRYGEREGERERDKRERVSERENKD